MEKTLTYFKTRFLLLNKGFTLTILGVLALVFSANAQYSEPKHYFGCDWTSSTYTYASIEDVTITDKSGNVVYDKAGDGCNDRTSGTYSGHYTLIESVSAFTLSAGAEYTFTMQTSNKAPSTLGSSAGVWIDFNGDQDFSDAGEFVSPKNWTFGVKTDASFDFQVPCSGTVGNIRMRIRTDRNNWTWAANQAGTQQTFPGYYGECEDFTGTYSVPSGLSSDFFAPDTVFIGTISNFVNSNQSGYISHSWTLDGTNYSTTNAEHVFATAGNYDVKLVSENCNGVDSTTKTVVVVEPSAPPIADFISNVNVIEIYETFQLTDLSTNGPTFWDWYLTNGTDTITGLEQPDLRGNDPKVNSAPIVSSGVNPVGTPKFFPDEGKWTVCLKSSNIKGSSSLECKDDYIEVKRSFFNIGPGTSIPDNIIGAKSGTIYDFNGPFGNHRSSAVNAEALIAPCGASSVSLSFDVWKVGSKANLKVYDGTDATGTPLHTGNGFTSTNAPAGTLTASSGTMYLLWNVTGNPTDEGFEASWTSVDGNGAAPIADFELPADTIYNAVYEDFINTSQNAQGNTTIQWLIDGAAPFGGNNFDLTDQIFLTNGPYDITLTITSCDGRSSTITKKLFVANPSTPTAIDFEASSQRPVVNGEITLTAITDKANRWDWSFFPPLGVEAVDGLNNQFNERTFKFSRAGVYAVQLKAYNYNASPDSSVSENKLTKTKYIIVVNHCTPIISVTTSSDVGINNVKVEDVASGDEYENSSASGQDGNGQDIAYSDFTDIGTIPMKYGAKYKITVERNTTINPMNRKIWIDWNVDGDFNDDGEMVGMEASAQTNSWTTEITVPDVNGAFPDATRMRIGVSYNNDLNMPCGASDSKYANRIGEFEDYSVAVVNDGDRPTITLVGNDTVYIEQASVPNYVSDSATANDPTQGDITDNIVMTTDVDQTLSGVYYENYLVADASGNEADPVVRVVYVVADQTAPTITVNGSTDTTIEVGTAWVDLGAKANDAKDGNLDGAIVTTGNVDVDLLGSYILTYFVQDNQGNSSTATRTVHVVDTELPVIDNVQADKTDPTAWTVDVQLQSVFSDKTSATDNYNSFSDKLTMSIDPESAQGGAAVDTRFQGTTTVTYVATDESGNATTQIIKYVVRDFVPPVIDLRTLDMIYHTVNTPYTPVAPTASDNLYSTTEISLTQTSDVNPYVLGTYSDTYTATDAAGNIATKVRTVHVVDNEDPKITGKAGGVLRVGVGSQFNAVDYVLFSDNYDSPADLIANSTLVYNDINVYEEGLYTAVFETVDNSGNESNQFTLYVDVDYNHFPLKGSVADLKLENILNVSPNPTTGAFKLSVNLPENEEIAINVYDAMGKKIVDVVNGSIDKGSYSVDISNNANGVYYVQMNIQGTILTKKVVLNR